MNTMTDIQHDAEAYAKKLADEVKTLREDLARMGNAIEELLRRRAGEAADEVSRRAEQALEEGRKLADDASRTIEANPLTSVGSAFGIGLLLGLLFGRR